MADVDKFLFVGIGGFVGAMGRHGLTMLVSRHTSGTFPFGTLVVNVLGSFLIGVLMTLAVDRQSLPENVRLCLVTGMLGALTTFSTFSHDTFELLHLGRLRFALFNVVGNVVLCLLAVVLGRGAVRLWP